jgi:hypothetical protein
MAGADGYYIENIPIILTVFLGLMFIYVLIKCLKHSFYQEIARLGILLAICLIEPIFIDESHVIVHSHMRILHIFRYAVVIGVIYQMMGCELKFREVEDVYFKKSWKKKTLVYFGLVVLEIFPGRLLFSHDILLWTKWEFLEHLGIIIYGVYLAGLFASFEKIRKESTN